MSSEDPRVKALATRRATAERLYVEAIDLDEAGRLEEAILLYRRAARLGDEGAQMNLAVVLKTLGGIHEAEGAHWSRHAARRGGESAAWNRAVDHRQAGNRRWWLYWMRISAERGHEDAIEIMAEVDRRQAEGRSWEMYRDMETDVGEVRWKLEGYRDGELSGPQLAAWAEDVLMLRASPTLAQVRRRDIVLVLRELADPARKLTRQRARELIFRLS